MAERAPVEEPGAAAAPEPAVQSFSFACFPLERIIVLVGVLAGPTIAALVLWQFARMRELSGLSDAMVSYDPGHARLFAGLTALVAVVLVLYGVIYLQVRAGTRVVVTADGLRLHRAAPLPFGLFGGERFLPWPDVRRAELVTRRTWAGFTRPTLEVAAPYARLRLSVADAWPTPGPPRPWAPRPPEGGWSQHPLVTAVTTAFAEAAVREVARGSLKSSEAVAD